MKDRKVSLKFLFICLVLLTTNLAYSQTDLERATRQTDILDREKEEIKKKLRPIPEKPPEIIKEEAPLKKEEQRVFIKKINLVGCESFPPEEFSFLIKKYENREVSFTELNTLAEEIKWEYLKRGIVATVFAPAQEIKDQTLILQVIESRMGELQIQKHRYFRKERLTYYWQIPKGEIIRYAKLSKSMELMNKNPDRKTQAVLRPGEKPGTTDILLSTKTYFPLHFNSTFDREGVAVTGESRTGFGLRHNNLLGLDDILLTGYMFGQDFDGIYAYHNVPISSQGTYLVYGYSHSAAKPKKEYDSSGIKSEALNTTVSIHQDIYNKEGDYAGEFSLGFEAKDKTIKQNTGVSNRDRLRIIRLGLNFLLRGLRSSTVHSWELSQGLPSFGASSQGNPLASRGAKSQFTKFNLEAQHKRLLPFGLQANLKFNGQVSSTKLTPQEEFSLGGIDSVRGYPAGDYLADHAILNSVELLIPSFFIPIKLQLPYAQESLREQITLVTFLDYGWGERRGALPTEKETVNLLSTGAGLRIKLFNQIILRLEWGFPLGANRTITEVGDSRFHISIDFQEKLPQEIERIRKEKKLK